MRAEDIERGGLSSALSRLTDGLARLLSEHVALARAEIREDARALGRDVAAVAAFVPLVVIGYALLCVALSLVLGSALGAAWGFALVGFVNLIAGAVGVGVAAQRLRETEVMDDSRSEVERSAALFRQTVRNHDAAERRLGA